MMILSVCFLYLVLCVGFDFYLRYRYFFYLVVCSLLVDFVIDGRLLFCRRLAKTYAFLFLRGSGGGI